MLWEWKNSVIKKTIFVKYFFCARYDELTKPTLKTPPRDVFLENIKKRTSRVQFFRVRFLVGVVLEADWKKHVRYHSKTVVL